MSRRPPGASHETAVATPAGDEENALSSRLLSPRNKRVTIDGGSVEWMDREHKAHL